MADVPALPAKDLVATAIQCSPASSDADNCMLWLSIWAMDIEDQDFNWFLNLPRVYFYCLREH